MVQINLHYILMALISIINAKLFELTFDNFFKEDEVYDLHVNNGRVLEHFHEGNMTYQTEMIKYKMPHAFVEISPISQRSRYP